MWGHKKEMWRHTDTVPRNLATAKGLGMAILCVITDKDVQKLLHEETLKVVTEPICMCLIRQTHLYLTLWQKKQKNKKRG